MKILHVGKYYPPYLGGMETVLENLALGLPEAGHDVSVLVAGQASHDSLETISSAGRSVRLTRLASLGVINSQPLTMGLVPALRREIHEFQPDLVHLHLPNPLLGMAWMALSKLERGNLPPFVIWWHADITRQKLGGKMVGPFVRWCRDRAAGICVSSSQLLSHSRVLDRHRDKVRIIPFGIEGLPWTEVTSSFDGAFLFVGRLVPYKGLDILLEAVAEIRDVSLVLVGEGPLEGKIRAQIQALGLSHRVTLAGRLSRDSLLEVMCSTRALVLPSLDSSETFGLVQLEAMAAGLPVLATDIPTGVVGVGVVDQTCLLVPPGDSQALGQALQVLYDDPRRCSQMGRMGREHFLAHYTRDRMIGEVVDWYESLLSPTRR